RSTVIGSACTTAERATPAGPQTVGTREVSPITLSDVPHPDARRTSVVGHHEEHGSEHWNWRHARRVPAGLVVPALHPPADAAHRWSHYRGSCIDGWPRRRGKLAEPLRTGRVGVTAGT